jgi:hypothetical protein
MRKVVVKVPEDEKEWNNALIVAAVVVVIAATPTLFDAYDAWVKHPRVRLWLGVWYIFAAFVALFAWRVFVAED